MRNSKKRLVCLIIVVVLSSLGLIGCAESVSTSYTPTPPGLAPVTPVLSQTSNLPALTAKTPLVVATSLTPTPPLGSVGQVVSTAPMGSPRASHTATLLQSGKVLITGGFQREGVFLASTELYDPQTNKFTPANPMTQSRISHTATPLPDGKVLIIGGLSGRTATNSAELYDPLTNQFRLTGKLQAARTDHTASLMPNGKVLVVGGSTTGTQAGTLAEAELYDPATGQFQSTGSLSTGLTSHAATLLPNGKVLISGGATAPQKLFTEAEIYDSNTGSFSLTSPLNFLRYKHATTLLPNGEVLIVGGADERDWQGLRDSVELYDPTKAVFVPGGKLLSGHFKIPTGAVLLQNGKVLVAGGSRQVEVYDPVTASFNPVAGSLNEALYFPTATRLIDGRVLLVGGYNNEGHAPVCTANAWLYLP